MSNTKRSSSGCFSAAFRLFLCSGSPQTHPSDNIMEPNADDNAAMVRVQSESGPGVVARLMGLDSLPEKNWVPKGETPGPPLLRQRNQNHEFLVVYMDEKKETGFEPRELKSQKVGCKKDHQEKNRKISKLENEPRRVSAKTSLKSSRCIGVTKNVQINRRANSRAKTPLNEVSIETKKKKKKKRKQCEAKKVEYSENSSEGSSSSPVSVLAAHQDNDISEDSKSLEVKLEKNFESTDDGENVFRLELVGRPPKLTDEDIKFSNWITKKVFTFEDFEEICVEFEDQILDLMLHQVVDDLVGSNA
ncbi:hypothetical protein V6N12_048717 [Hibiscus sabdariffa]|uniref:DUF3741 domain-containing protein n=1 Tax=Hibiscus sabdariffa TaxID=183260 RepID=A0ABR2EI26_9ROSI